MRSGDKNSTSNVRNEKKFFQFIEELVWLFQRNSDLDFKGISKNMEKLLSKNSPFNVNDFENNSVGDLRDFVPENPNRLFLVGILPVIFTDEKLFETNVDIADFAENVLQVSIPRWEKKSKYELIGHIVCNTSKANDKKLTDIANVLQKVAKNDAKAKKFMTQKRSEKRTWNEIIQQMINEKI